MAHKEKLLVTVDATVGEELLATTHADKHMANVLPPHKPTLDTCRSRCQQMSATLHMLLEAETCFEDDVPDGKADINLIRKLPSSMLEWRQALSTTNISLYRQEFLEKFLPQW